MEQLFSYGTLQLEQVQLSTFKRKLTGKVDAIIGYRLDLLEIKDQHVVAVSGKTHHPIVVNTGIETDRVDGTVFEISFEELLQADEYEVSDYKRVIAKLASGGTAWVYIQI